MIERHELQAWAGPAWDELTDDQRDQLARTADDLADTYPDPDDQPLRDAALSAAVQYWLGEISLDDAGEALMRARQAEAEARAAARQLTILAHGASMPETELATRLRVTRMAVRGWLGKR